MTPKEIAEGLSDAQRRAILWLPNDGDWSPTRAYWQVANAMAWLARNRPDLVKKGVVGRNCDADDCRWKLTPLGLEVRAYLLENPQ